jgi:hypothetical protein
MKIDLNILLNKRPLADLVDEAYHLVRMQIQIELSRKLRLY